MEGYSLIGYYYDQNTIFDRSAKTITPFMDTDYITHVLFNLEFSVDVHHVVIHLDFHDEFASHRTLQRVREALKAYKTMLAAKQINLIVDWSARTAVALQQLGWYDSWCNEFTSFDEDIN